LLAKLQVCAQLHTLAVNVTLPAFASQSRAAAAPLLLRAAGQQSIDRHPQPGAQQQTRRSLSFSSPGLTA